MPDPFEDGIILSDGNRRGLFLPQVWDQLPDPKDFLAHLKRKAGLPIDHWSTTMQAQRFITRGISAHDISPTGFWRQRQSAIIPKTASNCGCRLDLGRKISYPINLHIHTNERDRDDHCPARQSRRP